MKRRIGKIILPITIIGILYFTSTIKTMANLNKACDMSGVSFYLCEKDVAQFNANIAGNCGGNITNVQITYLTCN
jgi:hypothetical protein